MSRKRKENFINGIFKASAIGIMKQKELTDSTCFDLSSRVRIIQTGCSPAEPVYAYLTKQN